MNYKLGIYVYFSLIRIGIPVFGNLVIALVLYICYTATDVGDQVTWNVGYF